MWAGAPAPPDLLYDFIWAEYGSISWVIELILSCTGAVPHCSAGRMDCLIELDGGGGLEGDLVHISVYVCVCQRLSVSRHKIDTLQCSSDYYRTANCLSNNLLPQPPNTHMLAHALAVGSGSGGPQTISNSQVCARPQICYILILSRLRFAPIQLESIDERAERIRRLLIRSPHL